jgi:adenosylcobinamide kinase/adenosylcobinamide-phosphate guanylyltransferase
MKILVTGGARSGKTRYALARAEALGPRRIYLATGQALDEEMADRIRRHKAERGPGWSTVEEPLEIAPLLGAGEVVLLDCLTLWVSNLMMAGRDDEAILARFQELTDALAAAQSHVVVVTNEVGLGIVPMNDMARRYRDLIGWIGQGVGQVADEVILMVAGQPIAAKSR